VRNAEVDQASLLAAEYHFDGKPSVASASERKDSAFFATRRALVPTARTAERGKPRSRSPKRASASSARDFGRLIDAPVPRETCTQAHRISQVVEQVDLVVDDSADLQVKAVGSQVEGGQRCPVSRSLRVFSPICEATVS